MQTILLVLHIILGLGLIAVILIQQGTGATAGAAFGSGASSTVFGARGSASFLTRMTSILALVFFANSFLLAFLAKGQIAPKSIIERLEGDVPAVEESLSESTPALPDDLVLPGNDTGIDTSATPNEQAILDALDEAMESAPADVPLPADLPDIPSDVASDDLPPDDMPFVPSQ